MRLIEIAALVAGELEGDGGIVIRRASNIEEAIEGDVSFVANSRYEKYLETTRASAVIVTRAARSGTRDVPLVRVDDPYLSFLLVHEKFTPPREGLPVGVHPTAVVDPSATLGKNVAVGAHVVIGRRCVFGTGASIYATCVLGDDIQIGLGSTLYANVTVRERCTIGRRVIIHPGTVIGGDGFGFTPQADRSYRKIPQLGSVVVEDDVEIGANCTIDRAALGETRIGRSVKLDNQIHVAHSCHIGEHTIIAAQTGIAGSTKIGKNCVIGGQVGIAEHVEIADRVIIAANSGVTKSFLEPGITLFGFPARNRRKAARQEAALRHLPDLKVKVRQLEKRLQELESRMQSGANGS